jgi:SOS-response transcriptional repressor LexA
MEKKRSFTIPMVGSVQAGFPSPEKEVLSDTISLDEYLINYRGTSFPLQVSGDSLIEEGIMPGDPEIPSLKLLEIMRMIICEVSQQIHQD